MQYLTSIIPLCPSLSVRIIRLLLLISSISQTPTYTYTLLQAYSTHTNTLGLNNGLKQHELVIAFVYVYTTEREICFNWSHFEKKKTMCNSLRGSLWCFLTTSAMEQWFPQWVPMVCHGEEQAFCINMQLFIRNLHEVPLMIDVATEEYKVPYISRLIVTFIVGLCF